MRTPFTGVGTALMQTVIDRALDHPGIVRSTTVIALATQVPYRVRPLVDSQLQL